MSGQTIKRAKLADLKPDQRNANRGTERGRGMIEQSLRQHGAGRSILVDKNGQVIAGNKTLEVAAELNLADEVIVVETDGTQLVAVKRTDIDLDTPQGRALAVADNRTGQVGLDWDTDVLAGLVGEGVDLAGMWTADELATLLGNVPDTPTQGNDAPPHTLVCPHCGEAFEP